MADIEIVTADLPESILKEFRCETDGKAFVTRRGTARLAGKDEASIRRLLASIQNGKVRHLKGSKVLTPFIGQSFEGADVPDFLAAAIIQYYAIKGSETAELTLGVLAGVGLRSVIQAKTGWKPPVKPKLTAEQIIELCCLPCPTTWQKRFPVQYYEQLSRLTGLVANGVERPMWWARLTKELVYDYLPPGIYAEIKRCQTETGGWDKLHQFLSDDGITILETHQRRVLEHMQGAANLQQLKTTLKQACTGQYQLVLIEG